MSEEEKQAIEITKTIIEFAGDSYIPKENRNALQILLNLIDKQEEEIDTHIETENDYEHELARKDEEIEELKKVNKMVKIYKSHVIPENVEIVLMCKDDFLRITNNEFISKDKIREKIKGLEEIMEAICEKEDCEDYQTEEYYKIQGLNELLEE